MNNLSTKGEKPIRRAPIFHTNQELGVLAAKAGFPTLRALATAVEKHEQSVGEYLRGEAMKPTPLLEDALAKALKVSVTKLRNVVGIGEAPKSAHTQPPMAVAA